MLERLYLWLFKGVVLFVRHTPRLLHRLFISSMAWLLYHLDRSRKRVALANLDFAYGESLDQATKERILRECYTNLVSNLIDFVQNQGIQRGALLQKVRFENDAIPKELLQKHGQAIFITAHFGNWEILPLSIGAAITPLTGVGRGLGMRRLDAILQSNREQFGIQMLEKTGAMKGLLKTLQEGRSIGLLVDQNTATKEGILIDFFGKKARHIPTAAILARRYELPIIPAFTCKEPNGTHLVRFYPPIYTPKSDNAEADILASVQQQAAVTEEVIRENPGGWFWFHRRFKNQYPEIYERQT